jgi:hypothetical protein
MGVDGKPFAARFMPICSTQQNNDFVEYISNHASEYQ